MNKIVNGKTIKLSAEEEQKVLAEWQENEEIKQQTDWIHKRQRAYRSIQEQLDMIYWDKKNGTNLWEEHIDFVKLTVPKTII